MSKASPWAHSHVFLMGHEDDAVRRTKIVLTVTLVTMVTEILAGTYFNSMALLADGWHMSTHAAALGIAVWTYGFCRKHANNRHFTFGTGKVPSLAGFFSAILLGMVAAIMVWESADRLRTAQTIAFDQAMLVAGIGLIVNLFSAWLLRDHDHHHHHNDSHNDDDHHDHDHQSAHHHDHNLHAAYIHVLADAMTSVLAIIALILGKYMGWWWLDPIMGIVGAIMIARWTWGLLRQSGAILVDYHHDPKLLDRIETTLCPDPKTHISDLHVWTIAPGHYGAIISLVSESPHSVQYYKGLLETIPNLSHISIEVNAASS